MVDFGASFLCPSFGFSLIMFYPAKHLSHDYNEEKNDAVALSPSSFKSTNKKCVHCQTKGTSLSPFWFLVSGNVLIVCIHLF